MAQLNSWGKEVAQGDDRSPDEKSSAQPRGSWYDLVCGTCGRRCCQNCTADGDYTRCAQTMFADCSVCGHPSDRHSAVEH